MNAIPQIATLGLPDEFGGASMQFFANLHRNPQDDAVAMIDVPCSQECGATIRCMRIFSARTACDECRKKWEKAEALQRAKKHWEDAICPPGMRDTDREHVDFPKAQYEMLKGWAGNSSLFFFGPTGAGKTRMALLLLKRILLKSKFGGVLWPEDFESMRTSRNATAELKQYGRFDVLLLDDVLLTGAKDDRLTSWLKNLLDYMMRHNHHWIVTSQIGGPAYLEQARQFGPLGKSDEKRIEAILSRLTKQSQVIPFNKAVPVAGESAF
jgi:DNA replication protein DnaC